MSRAPATGLSTFLTQKILSWLTTLWRKAQKYTVIPKKTNILKKILFLFMCRGVCVSKQTRRRCQIQLPNAISRVVHLIYLKHRATAPSTQCSVGILRKQLILLTANSDLNQKIKYWVLVIKKEMDPGLPALGFEDFTGGSERQDKYTHWDSSSTGWQGRPFSQSPKTHL